MRAAVLGSPIAHSLSPVLHRAAYAELGLDWTYDVHEVGAGGLRDFLDELGPEWVGLSLTMPLKQEALALVDWASPRARVVAAVNTVLLSRGRRLGTNTDIGGMLGALAEGGLRRARTGTVLGGGATARSALAALAALGVSAPAVVVRRPEAVDDLRATARGLDQVPDVRRWAPGAEVADALRADVVVASVPGEAAAGLADLVPDEPGVLLDVTYAPWPTTLATAWLERGGVVLSGLDLLVHQAVLQVELMTGRGSCASRLLPVMRAAVHARNPSRT